MKSLFNETNIKIGLIVLMIVGMIFLNNYQKANTEFNISDMSVVNSVEKIEAKILETPKVEVSAQSQRVETVAVENTTGTTVVTETLPIATEEKKTENAQSQPEINTIPVANKENKSEAKPVEPKPETAQENQTNPVESPKENKIEAQTQTTPVDNTVVIENAESKQPEKIPLENKETSPVPQTEEKIVSPVEPLKTEADKADTVSANKVEEKKETPLPAAAENKAVEDQKLLPLVEEKKTEQKEDFVKTNESNITAEERIVNSNFTNLNFFVVMIAIVMNLIVYFYVYRHLSMNISKNLHNLKKEMIELEESFSYRSITDI